MKKQDLIQIHNLLAEVSEYCADDGVEPELEEYRALGTEPTSIHHAKGDHRDAVFALADALTESVAGSSTGRSVPDRANAD